MFRAQHRIAMALVIVFVCASASVQADALKRLPEIETISPPHN